MSFVRKFEGRRDVKPLQRVAGYYTVVEDAHGGSEWVCTVQHQGQRGQDARTPRGASGYRAAVRPGALRCLKSGLAANDYSLSQAENGHADSLRVVHNGGGDLSVVDSQGCSPCHYAAMNGHTACVAVIIDVSGDFRSKNAFGFTPLRLALRNQHASCASLIRSSIERIDVS